MRIVQLVTKRQRRGAEMFAAELSMGLVERGHEVYFTGLSKAQSEPLVPEGTVAEDVTETEQRLLDPFLLRRLVRYFRQVQPEVVQANGASTLKYSVLAKRLSSAPWPIVYRNIGFVSDWLPKRPGQFQLNKWLYGGTAAAASVSTASRDDLVAKFGLDPAWARVIRRGVPTEPLIEQADGRRVLCNEGIPSDPAARVLLHVGSYSPEKNHAGLLRIFERVRSEVPRTYLVLVGDGPLRSEVEATYGGDSGVLVLGRRADVPHLMAGADVFVLPSLTEGLPGVVLEAGAQRLPSVAYDVGGVRESIREGETGRVIVAGDEERFARAVMEVLADTEHRKEMRVQARAFIESDYSLARSVDSFERLYRQILSS